MGTVSIGIGVVTADEERPQGSEDWRVIVPQPSESLGHPSVGGAIVVHVSSSYTALVCVYFMDWEMDYRQSASFWLEAKS